MGDSLPGVRLKISVIIPCFNRERRIGAAIESALGQELAPLEVVVIDDGSVDRSAAIAEEFGEPVRVVRTPNRGPSSARNTGLREARGDWVAFLDSDDTWAPEKLATQVRAIEAFPGTELVFSDTRTFADERVEIESRFDLGGVRGAAVERQGDFLRFNRSLFSRLLEESRIFTSAVLVRRRLPLLEFPERFKGPEDWALWMTLALRYDFAAVDRVQVHMHYDGDNLTATYAPILGRGVGVLEELANDEELNSEERRAVEASLRKRRLGALYHSLAEGDVRQARKLLADVPRSELGTARWLAYWLLGRLPGGMVRALVRGRLGLERSAAPEGDQPSAE